MSSAVARMSMVAAVTVAAAVGTVSPTGAVASSDLRPQRALPCQEEADLSSASGDRDTEIRFENVTTRPVSIYWLDYDGKRELYVKRLRPGRAYLQPTYVGHPWVVTDLSGHRFG